MAGLSVSTAMKGLSQTPVTDSQHEALSLIAGQSQIIRTAAPIERISVGYGDIAEATPTGMSEVLLNAKTPGVTSLIIWQRGGGEVLFDVTVQAPRSDGPTRLEAIEHELERDLPGQTVE